MTALIIHDPNVDERSEMHRRPALCSGAKTGRVCVHYLVHAKKVDSLTSDMLHLGETFRVCLRSPAIALEFTHKEVPAVCNKYVPRRKTVLAMLRLEPDRGAYHPLVEEYNPITMRHGAPVPPPAISSPAVSPPTSGITADDALQQIVDDNLSDFRGSVGAPSPTSVKPWFLT